MGQWSYMKSGLAGEQQVGPITQEQFIELVRTGKIKPATKVYNSATTKGEWAIASTVPALQAIFKSVRVEKQREKTPKVAGPIPPVVTRPPQRKRQKPQFDSDDDYEFEFESGEFVGSCNQFITLVRIGNWIVLGLVFFVLVSQNGTPALVLGIPMFVVGGLMIEFQVLGIRFMRDVVSRLEVMVETLEVMVER